VSVEDVGFGAAWVVAAIVFFVVVAILGALGGHRPKRARLLAERLAADATARAPSFAPRSTTPSRARSTTSRRCSCSRSSPSWSSSLVGDGQ
jgi:hypothetical protein